MSEIAPSSTDSAPPAPVWRWRVAMVAMLVGGAAVAARLLSISWPLRRLPLWDGAGNGWGAVELWAALADGRLVDFVVRANAQDKWPFGFSLFLVPFVAIGEASFEAATLLPAIAFALTPALLLWLAREIDDGERGVAAGTVAATLWLASPLPRALATVVMRETTGAALGVAALALYLRARRLGTLAAWRWTGVTLLVLFFTKYNYFLLGGTAIALHALLERTLAERRALAEELRDGVLRRGWRSPARWVVLVAVLSTGFLIAGENPGNLIYAALVIATILCFSLQWRSFRVWPAKLHALSPPLRGLSETLLLPLWLWSLSPEPIHPRSMIAFLRNRPGELPVLSFEALTFQPVHWALDYFVSWSLGLVASLVALAFLAVALARRGARRALALAAAVGFVAVSLHPMKEARFVATVAPALLLATAIALADAVAMLQPRWSRPLLWLLAFGALAAGLMIPFAQGLDERLLADHRLLTADPAFAEPLRELARSAAGRSGVAFLGATNELSESLLFWRSYATLGRELDWVETPKGLDASNSAVERESRVRSWLERERPRRIVSLVPLRDSRLRDDRDYLRYNAWQVEALERIVAGEGWQRGDRRAYPQVGLRVVTWNPPRGRAAPHRIRGAAHGAQAPRE